ncbi:O-acetyl-ADP-ribose deacetylase (regulator of RNase III) [Paraburkholderia sp. HC6.4b]|uniref:hypothetical protein n=1 Tax=unclassified Paraburkholderia TaxID=2615204 RepID=UPI00180AEB80|nr:MULTISPECIES: hypothetical protein [unclassified Paraburkholderia]MBB5409429.1 O-acetyl-ADP-ribose deacetylase (regulator of RNase III) [Paraburkholderia sp. HC6.4b]MBB5451159.1 O-acetyl-ADP-ribose deacetylase (regulator of RNase III) [Paraburkholderia sp. Kb1A]
MIEAIDGNILYVDVEAIVNPVNCVGVMGRGLALQFRKVFPVGGDNYLGRSLTIVLAGGEESEAA